MRQPPLAVAALLVAGCAGAAPLHRLDPPDLPPSRGLYTHVVVADPRRLVFVAGQVALDSTGRVVGAGDAGAQARQVYANVERALRSAGAGWDDVVKTTTYVTPEADVAAVLAARRQRVTGALPTNTLLVVTRLARPELLLEVEAVAVLPR